MDVGSIVNLAFTAFLAVCAVLGAIFGFVRGMSRQVVKLITVVASAVGAFLISINLLKPFVDWVASTGIEGILGMLKISLDGTTKEMILSFDTETLVYISAIPFSLVLAPLSFVAVYLIFSLITTIIHKLICGAFGFTRRNNNVATRFIGLGIGAVQGLLISLILLVPLCGLANTAHVAVLDAKEENPESDYTVFLSSTYDTYFGELDKNPIYAAASNITLTVYEKYSNIELYGERADITEVTSDLVGIYAASAGLDGANISALREQDKEAIDLIIENALDSKYVSVILTDTFRAFSSIVENGLYEFNLPDNEKVKKLVNDVVVILGTTTKETIADDITTFKNVYYLLSDGGVLTAADDPDADIFSLFTKVDANGRTLMSRLNDELMKNPRTVVLCSDMADVAMVLVLNNSGMSETIAPETLDNVKGSLNEAIAIDKNAYETEEEYKAAVSDTIGTTLDECNIALEPEQLDIVTDYVIQEFEGKEEVTDEDMVNFMSQYYDAYMSGSLEVPEGTEIPEGVVTP